MTAPDRAAAVEIALGALGDQIEFTLIRNAFAQIVVDALDEAKLLRRPDEAAYVAALEAVAEAARVVARPDDALAVAHHIATELRPALAAVPAAGPTPAQEAAFAELVQLGQEIERSGEGPWCNCQAPGPHEGPWHPLGDTPF